MWHEYTQALITAFGLAGLGFAIAKLVVVFGERAIEKRHGVSGMRDSIVMRAKLETKLEARRVVRVAELKELDGEVEDILRRRKTLERQLRESQVAGEKLIRLIGEEVKGTPCYIAMVVNKYITGANFQQKANAYIDPHWARPQTVEVWAKTIADARAEVERRFPPALGYSITRMQDSGASDGPVAKAG